MTVKRAVKPPPDREERLTRRVHAGLLVLLALSLGVWLWRTYGFEPLRLVEPAP